VYKSRSFIAFITAIVSILFVLQFVSAQGGGSISGTISTIDGGMPEWMDATLDKLISNNGEPYWEFYPKTPTISSTGEYHFENVDAGTYLLFVQGANYSPEYYDGAYTEGNAIKIIVNEGESVTGIDVALERLGAIEGTVTNENGEPIADLLIFLYTEMFDGTWDKSGVLTTAVDGTFELAGLHHGNYRIRFGDMADENGDYFERERPEYQYEFYNGAQDFESATNIVVTSSTPVSGIDAQLERLPSIPDVVHGKVAGRVTDVNGNPLSDVPVALYILAHYAEWYEWQTAYTGADGTYQFEDIKTDVVRVRFGPLETDPTDPFGYRPKFYDEASDISVATDIAVTPGNITTGIDGQLESAGLISGRVTDTSGNPIENITVYLYEPPYENRIGLIRTDADGNYTFGLLTAGTYRVSATDINLATGQQVSNIDMQTFKTSTISGRVLDVDGNLITSSGIRAHLYTYDSAQQKWTKIYADDGYVNGNGEFTISNIPNGTYRVEFSESYLYSNQYQTEYYEDTTTVDAATDITVNDGSEIILNDVTIALRGSISGTVTNDDGMPLKDTLLTLFKRIGKVAPYSWEQVPGANQTAENGTYKVARLNAGVYRIKFLHISPNAEYSDEYYDNSAILQQSTDVVVEISENVTDIDAVLNPPRQILGRITDSDGKPLSNVQVELLYQNDEKQHVEWVQKSSMNTNNSGEYAFGGIGGPYWSKLNAGFYLLCIGVKIDGRDDIQCYGETANEGDLGGIFVGLDEPVTRINIAVGGSNEDSRFKIISDVVVQTNQQLFHFPIFIR